MPGHFHHRPYIPPHRPPQPPPPRGPSPPPPSPPPPPEAMTQHEGDPTRCYFCGTRLHDPDVTRTKYHVGHGYQIFVSICPTCLGKKARGEPPFDQASGLGGAGCGVVGVLFGLLFLCVPGYFFFSTFLGPRLTGGGLTLTVDRVEHTGHNFRVHMTASNHTDDKLTLPLFGYFFVTDDLGNQYDADPFSSTFPRDVAPGATVSGYADMKAPLNPRASELTAELTTVFGSFRVDSARVEGVRVRGNDLAR